MFSVGAGALRTAPAVPRGRALAGWAAGLSCAFHVLVAGLLWRDASERETPPAPAAFRQNDFYVTLLPPRAGPQPSASSATFTVAPSVAPSSPLSSEAVEPSSSALPRSSTPSSSRLAKPSASRQATPARTPTANTPRDFRWRGEDAAAQGLPRARGEGGPGAQDARRTLGAGQGYRAKRAAALPRRACGSWIAGIAVPAGRHGA